MDEDARFSSQGARLAHIDAVYAFLGEVIATRTTAEWLEIFEAADLPAAPMYSLDDLIADPHLREVGLLRAGQHPSEGPMTEIANPTEWSDTPPGIRHPAPRLGEHTREVLRELGLDETRIAALVAAGIVRCA